MPLAQRTVVECTNCGGPGPGFWITFAALIVAACALVIAFREHREFMRTTKARARFRVAMKIVNYDNDLPDRPLVHEASSIRPIVRVRVENYGQRAAGTVLHNVFAPEGLENFRWCGPNGEEVDAPKPYRVDEPLRDANGDEVPAVVLVREEPRLQRHGTDLDFFCFTLALPDEGEVTVPLRATASADEIPDEVRDYRASLMVRAVRKTRVPF